MSLKSTESSDTSKPNTPNGNSVSQTKTVIRSFFVKLVWISTFILLGSWIAYFSARYFWLGEIFTHFRFQYLVIGIAGIVTALAVRKNRILAGLLILTTVPHGYHIGQYYFPLKDSTPVSSEHRPLKILSMNVLEGNMQFEETLQAIFDQDADILVVVEFSEPWYRAIGEKLKEKYPYSTYAKGKIWAGNYVFSKTPIRPFQVNHIWKEIGGAIINWDGTDVLIVPSHPASPINPVRLVYRTWAMKVYKEMAEGAGIPFVLAGDFNCTAGSPYFHDLVDGDLIRDSRYGFGWQGSWPHFFPIAKIPIDHVLVSKHWKVINREVLQPTGSDHYPISATLQLKSQLN